MKIGNRQIEYEQLIEKNWVTVSTIYTLLMAINAAIAIDKGTGLYKSVSIYAFILGVSVVILQLVVFNYVINNRNKESHRIIEEVKESIDRNENLLLPKHCVSLSSEIWTLVQTGTIKSITIICYGTSGFDGLISKLKSENLQIKTNVLVCSDTSEHILYETDRAQIKKLIDENASDNIVFTKSPIPSTIRACILYDDKCNPVWSSIQAYYYNCDITFHSFDYKNSFTVVAKKDGSNMLLTEMEAIIKKEFKRLRDFDYKKLGLTDCQIDVVRLIEKEGSISIKEYAKKNSVNNTTATIELEALVDKDILKKESTTNKNRTVESYILAGKS